MQETFPTCRIPTINLYDDIIFILHKYKLNYYSPLPGSRQIILWPVTERRKGIKYPVEKKVCIKELPQSRNGECSQL